PAEIGGGVVVQAWACGASRVGTEPEAPLDVAGVAGAGLGGEPVPVEPVADLLLHGLVQAAGKLSVESSEELLGLGDRRLGVLVFSELRDMRADEVSHIRDPRVTDRKHGRGRSDVLR